jgi:hypothetical protein
MAVYPVLAALLILTCVGLPLLYLAGLMPGAAKLAERLPDLTPGRNGQVDEPPADPSREAALAGTWMLIESNEDVTLSFHNGVYQRLNPKAPPIKGTYRLIGDQVLQVEWVTPFGEKVRARFDLEFRGKQLLMKRHGGGRELFLKTG